MTLNPLHQNSINSLVQWLRKVIRKYLNLKEVTPTISKTEI